MANGTVIAAAAPAGVEERLIACVCVRQKV